MRSTILIALAFTLLSTTAAFAQSHPDSRAMQLAKRVAAMENSRDLPSRAVWLSNRVVKNSRELAYLIEKNRKSRKPARAIKN